MDILIKEEMIELNGKYNYAKVFTNRIEESAVSQIINLLNQDFSAGSKIRIMSDTHAGTGCVIGFTANLGEKVVPNLVGVDIGCGMLVIELGKMNIDLPELDYVIHSNVPSGRNVHEKMSQYPELDNLHCLPFLRKTGIFYKSIGTLGGGNHFCELDEDDIGNKYLVIHSGSRNLGKQVAEYYQSVAVEDCKGLGDLHKIKQDIIDTFSKNGKKNLIQSSLKEMEKKFYDAQPVYPKELCFLTGEHRQDYLDDMYICQHYAVSNRAKMAENILSNLGYDLLFDNFSSIHNYIDEQDNIIRKGAVSAYNGERLIIPINMRDGSIIATGKGNSDWNFSAPHGAGRLMGRNEAKRKLSMDEFRLQMIDVYTTSVGESTLDEAPNAYKPIQEIIDNVEPTVEIEKIIKPIYNFKATE